jgi:DNA-binding HxlR family transcriptional regulator
VSCTLDVLGDRWTLLVVRDLIRGKRRFAELVESPERIPTNILAERLKRLVSLGVVQSRRYSDHPPRLEYQLTAKGEDLRPVLRAMVEWGVKHAGGRVPPPLPPRSDGGDLPAPSVHPPQAPHESKKRPARRLTPEGHPN